MKKNIPVPPSIENDTAAYIINNTLS